MSNENKFNLDESLVTVSRRKIFCKKEVFSSWNTPQLAALIEILKILPIYLTMPAFSYSFLKKVEHRLFNEDKWGMFGLIVLEKG